MPSDWISAGGSINQEEEEEYQEEKEEEEEGNSWHSDGAGLLPIGKAPAGRSFDHPPTSHQWMALATIVEDHRQQNCKNGSSFFGALEQCSVSFWWKAYHNCVLLVARCFFRPFDRLGHRHCANNHAKKQPNFFMITFDALEQQNDFARLSDSWKLP